MKFGFVIPTDISLLYQIISAMQKLNLTKTRSQYFSLAGKVLAQDER